MRWTLKEQKRVLATHPFAVEELHLTDEKSQPLSHPFYRLASPDWVNILPVTTDGQAILIRQPRVGNMTEILETPGGVVDSHEKDVTMAALRELEEETGYTTQRILPLGALNPNPAIMNNRLHMFVAVGCYLNPQRKHFPDASEAIDVVTVPAKSLTDMVRTRQIDNALAALCIMLAGKYVPVSE